MTDSSQSNTLKTNPIFPVPNVQWEQKPIAQFHDDNKPENYRMKISTNKKYLKLEKYKNVMASEPLCVIGYEEIDPRLEGFANQIEWTLISIERKSGMDYEISKPSYMDSNQIISDYYQVKTLFKKVGLRLPVKRTRRYRRISR